MKYVVDIGDYHEEYDNVKIMMSQYTEGDGIYMGIRSKEGEPLDDLSINLPEPFTQSGDMMALSGDLAESNVKFVEDNNLGEYVCNLPSGFRTYPVVQLNMKQIDEYIKSGDIIDERPEAEKDRGLQAEEALGQKSTDTGSAENEDNDGPSPV